MYGGGWFDDWERERENLRVCDFNAYDERVSLIIDVVKIVKKYNT